MAAGASIQVKGSTIRTTTGETGTFKLNNLPSAAILSVSILEHEPGTFA